jgi:hypothetical protein
VPPVVDGEEWRADIYMEMGAATGWQRADYPHHTEPYCYATMPNDHRGDSLLWDSCGCLWQWCPAWFSRKAPTRHSAMSLCEDMASIRAGYEPPRRWSPQAAYAVLRVQALRDAIKQDDWERERKKPKPKR